MMKTKFNVSYCYQCAIFNIGYSTFMRWKKRVDDEVQVRNKPGPKYAMSPDMASIEKDIESLKHGRKRSHGVEALKQKYKGTISRRELDALIKQCRDNFLVSENQRGGKIEWHTPGVAWAVDDTEMRIDDRKVYINNIQDMHSKYKLPPVAGENLIHGEELAGHFARLFHEFGAPLFLKRDNGGNLNHTAVNQVLDEFKVIPINSPPSYPRYNGSVERYQEIIKKEIENLPYDLCSIDEISMAVEISFHNLNHKNRTVLKGKSSCQSFHCANKPKFSKIKRKEVLGWLHNLSIDILENQDNNVNSDFNRIWRIVCQAWLQRNEHLTVSQYDRVLPYFFPKISHK